MILPKRHALGLAPFLWLIYVLPFATWFWFQPEKGLRWLAAAGMCAFLVLYFRGFWLKGWDLVPVLAGLIGLGLLFYSIHIVGAVFFIYAVGFLGDFGPPKRGFLALAVVLGLLTAEAVWLGHPLWGLLVPFLIALIVGVPTIQFTDRERVKDALIRAQAEIELLSKTAERERIARDVHDLLGHSLSMIVLKAQLAGKLLGKDAEAARREIRELEQEARNALMETRQAIRDWRQASFQDQLAQSKEMLARAGLGMEAHILAEVGPSQLEAALSLILREAVTNIVRHARASNCSVVLSRNEELVLEIADDGIGISAVEGSGMAGMRARAESLGGKMTVQSVGRLQAQGQGTHLLFQFPLGAP